MEISGQIHTSHTVPSAKNHATNQIWGRVDPRADLEVLERRKVCYPYRDSIPWSSNQQSIHYTDYNIPVPRWDKQTKQKFPALLMYSTIR
jgi:hypothetical protein